MASLQREGETAAPDYYYYDYYYCYHYHCVDDIFAVTENQVDFNFFFDVSFHFPLLARHGARSAYKSSGCA
jgi:hypothetical protein